MKRTIEPVGGTFEEVTVYALGQWLKGHITSDVLAVLLREASQRFDITLNG